MGMLVEKIRGRELKDITTPNPVTSQEAAKLVSLIEEVIPEPPVWLKQRLNDSKTSVITFGGTTSCFRLLRLILDKSIGITREDMQKAIDLVVDTSPETLSIYPQQELIFPKLCLMLAVAKKYEIKEVDFHWANGSTLGVAIYHEFWQ